jgi:hypothetical protein
MLQKQEQAPKCGSNEDELEEVRFMKMTVVQLIKHFLTFYEIKTTLPYRILGYRCGGYEQFHLLGYNAVYSFESQPTFRNTISPPSLGSKNS